MPTLPDGYQSLETFGKLSNDASLITMHSARPASTRTYLLNIRVTDRQSVLA